MTPEDFTIGYDLDGGGYEFTRGPFRRTVAWEDPDPDYLPLSREQRRICNEEYCFFVAFPRYKVGELPGSFLDEEEDTFVLASEGVLTFSDHDCIMCDAVGCERCDDGRVESPGCRYGIYVYTEE